MYIADWRWKGAAEPVFKVSAPSFEEAQTVLAQDLLTLDVVAYHNHVETDAGYNTDFAVALSEVEFRQQPFGLTINNIEVSIYETRS